MVRWTVGMGAAAGAFVVDDVAKVVVVTVCVVVVVDDGADGVVCADASPAVAKNTKARDSLFTVILDLGEIERFLILFYGAGLVRECKGQEGRGLW